MKKFIWGLVLTTSLGFGFQAQAKTLISSSDWSLRKVEADNPYCAMSKSFQGNIDLTVAKNNEGEGTLAFNFNRNAFDVVRFYDVNLNVGGVDRQYSIRPAAANMMVVRVGTDPELLSAMRNNDLTAVTIDEEQFNVPLNGYDMANNQLNGCLNIKDTPRVVEVKPVVPISTPTPAISAKVEIPTRIPVETVIGKDKDREIATLITENRRLVRLLSTQEQRLAESTRTINSKTDLTTQLGLLEQQNQNLKAQVNQMERDLVASRNVVNPDLSQAMAEKDRQIAQLKNQNLTLSSQLKSAQMPIKNDLVQIPEEFLRETEALRSQVSQLKSVNESLRAEANNNIQNASSDQMNMMQAQVAKLTNENKSLRDKINNMVPEVVFKEIIKEVPVTTASIAQGDDETAAQAMAFRAERDEYRRLLQIERKRKAELGDVTQQVSSVTGAQNNLIDDVRRLEKEKVELIRKLEFAKKGGQITIAEDPSTTLKLNELSTTLAKAKVDLEKTKAEKEKLTRRMTVIDNEAQEAQRLLAAQSKIKQLADDSPETIQKDIEAKTLRAEIAALEAQNRILYEDSKVEKEPIEIAERLNPADVQAFRNRVQEKSLPIDLDKTEIAPVLEPTRAQIDRVIALPKTMPMMSALSGDEIRQLVAQSKIPLQTSIDRVDNVSNENFAAFRWDTGMVYGSGEQARVNMNSNFNGLIQNYIQKTASRCEGAFDQEIHAIDTVNELTVKSADIACVDENANGNAASIVFFTRGNMFYALAHEADMDNFKIAMDMRDRLIGSVDQIF